MQPPRPHKEIPPLRVMLLVVNTKIDSQGRQIQGTCLVDYLKDKVGIYLIKSRKACVLASHLYVSTKRTFHVVALAMSRSTPVGALVRVAVPGEAGVIYTGKVLAT